MLNVSAIRRRIGDERGFTLIELLVSMLIGMVVLSAILTITEVSARSASRTSDRAETTQRSRTAMTQLVQGLRAQVCPSATKPPIASATKDLSTKVEQLTYYAEVGDLPVNSPSPLAFAPQKRRLTFDPRGTGSIVEEVWNATRYPASAAAPNLPDDPMLSTDPTADPKFTYPSTPTRTRTLATQIARVPNPAGGDFDFLRYYGFETTTPLAVSLSTATTAAPGASLPANSIAKVVRIDVSFKTRPSNGNTEALRDSDMQTSINLRNSDYTNQTAAEINRVWGPRCD